MMFSWTVRLPEETKIADAYQMLKKQGEHSRSVRTRVTNKTTDFHKFFSLKVTNYPHSYKCMVCYSIHSLQIGLWMCFLVPYSPLIMSFLVPFIFLVLTNSVLYKFVSVLLFLMMSHKHASPQSCLVECSAILTMAFPPKLQLSLVTSTESVLMQG